MPNPRLQRTGRVRLRIRRGNVEANEECAAAERPSRYAAWRTPLRGERLHAQPLPLPLCPPKVVLHLLIQPALRRRIERNR